MSIGFVISGDTLIPEAITSLLNVSPSSAWRKGDIFKSRYGKKDGSVDFRDEKRPWGKWALSSVDGTSSIEIEDHASFIINQIEPSKDILQNLITDENLRVSIHIWWQPKGGYGGYTLSASTVRKLSMLCNEMDFYFS